MSDFLGGLLELVHENERLQKVTQNLALAVDREQRVSAALRGRVKDWEEYGLQIQANLKALEGKFRELQKELEDTKARHANEVKDLKERVRIAQDGGPYR